RKDGDPAQGAHHTFRDGLLRSALPPSMELQGACRNSGLRQRPFLAGKAQVAQGRATLRDALHLVSGCAWKGTAGTSLREQLLGNSAQDSIYLLGTGGRHRRVPEMSRSQAIAYLRRTKFTKWSNFASWRAQVRSSAFRLHWPGQAKGWTPNGPRPLMPACLFSQEI